MNAIRKLQCVTKLLSVCAILPLTACEAEQPQHYLTEGKRFFQEGVMDSARLQFKNALQLDPNLADAYYHLALIDERKQDWGKMVANLQETIAIDPDHLQGQIKLGQLYLSGGELERAEQSTRAILRLSPDEPTGHLMLASLHFRQNLPDLALQEVDEVLAKQADWADALGLKAMILSAQQRHAQAIELLRKGLEHHPDDRELRLLKIRLEIDAKQFDAAIHDYQALIEKRQDDLELLLALAGLFDGIGQTRQAEQVLQQGIDKHPQQSALKLALFELTQRRDADQARQLLQQFIAQAPNDAPLKFRLADYDIARRRFADAETQLQELAKGETEQALMAKVKLAGLLLLRRQSLQAEPLLAEVLTADPQRSEALQLRAELRLSKQDAEGAIADLRVVLRDRPKAIPAMLLLAQAQLLKGEPEVAESQWRKILQIQPGNKAAMSALLKHLMQRGEIGRAEELLQQSVKLNPGDAATLEWLIQLKVAAKDWVGALAIVEQLKTLPESALAGKYWAGFIVERQGQSQQALKAYQDILAEHEYLPALEALSRLYRQAGQTAELIAYLKRYIAAHLAATEAKPLLLSIYMADRQYYAEASRWLQDIADSNANTREGFMARLKLAELSWHQGDAALALSQLSDLIGKPEMQESALLMRANVLLGEQDFVAAEADLEALLQIAPNNQAAQLLMAQLYRLQGRPDNAKQVWLTMLEQQADNMAALQPLCVELFKQGDWPQAEALIAKALKADPGDSAILELEIQLRLGQQDWSSARQSISALQQKPEAGHAAKLWAATLAINRQDYHEAIGLYQEVLGQVANDPQALLGLIQAYQQLGQASQALIYLKDLLQKQPEADQLYQAVARLYAQNNQWSQAEQLLLQSLQRKPRAVSSHIALAALHAAQGKDREAEKAFTHGLAILPENLELMNERANFYLAKNKIEQAISAYREILRRFPQHDAAANNLADLLATFRAVDQASIRLATNLMQRFKNASDPAIQDTYGWVCLQAGDTACALAALQKAAVGDPKNARVHYHLAEAYKTFGDKQAAVTALELAISEGESGQAFWEIDKAKRLMQYFAGG